MQPKQPKTKREIKDIVNLNKNKKKVDLSKEFDEFKQRIQEFQNKNEEIISRIRDAYTIKKKAIQGSEYLPEPLPQNNAFFKNYNDGESVASSCDYSKNVVFEGNMMKQPHGINQIQSIYNSNVEEYHDNNQKQRLPIAQQNKSNQQLISNSSIKSSNVVSPHYEVQSQQRYQINYDDYIRSIQSNRLNTEEDMNIIINSSQVDPKLSGKFAFHQEHYLELEEKYKEEQMRNQELEEMLQAKEAEVSKIKNQEFRFKSFASNLKHIVEDGLQTYNEQIVSERFLELEKYIKKCEQRLKNLSLKLRDSIEEKKSRKIIHRSRSKRNSVSKARKDQSSMSEEAESTPKISRAYSQSKVKNKSENPSKHKQFEQIAADYENMIKAKIAQIEVMEKRLNEEIKAKEIASNELIKSKALLQQKEREFLDLKKIKKPVKDEYSDGKQSKDLKEKLSRYQDELNSKELKEKELSQTIQKLEKSKKTMHDEYTENLNKNKMLKNKAIQQLQNKLKDMESNNQKLIAQFRDKLTLSDKKMMQKQCEMMTVLNKLKKVENQCLIKEQKLKDLQGLLLKESDHGDLLDKSMSMDTSVLSHTEIRHLHENIRRLEEEIEEKKSIIYDLQKEKYLYENSKREMEGQITNISRVNTSLEQKIFDLKKEIQSNKYDDEKDIARDLQEKNQLIEQYEAQKELLVQQKEELSTKNNQLMQELKKLKESNLATNRQLIKINSELNFNKNEQGNLQAKLSKSKEELNSFKQKFQQYTSQMKQRERQLEKDCANLREQVQNYKNHILQLQTVGNRNNNYENKEEDMLLNSLHVSQISFNYQPKHSHEQELAALKEKLKDVEMALDIKTGMEEKIQNQYRSNLEIIRLDNADKNQELQKCRNLIEQYRSQMEKIKNAQRQDESFENYKISLYEEKIVQMEDEYNALKESQERLNEMLHEIVETVKMRDEDRDKMLRQVQEKERTIQQLRELLEMKDIKYQPNKTMKSDTMKEFSLRISGDHSQEFIDTAELSYLSNISDVFKRDDILQQKIKRGRTSREEQVKLFAKTSAYIKSLKGIIQTKQKRIKMLEKQLASIKSQQNRSWSDKERSSVDKPYYTQELAANDDIEECDEYKDYDSVQLDTRRSKYYELTKQLQNEKDLAVEENKLLSNQIEALHDEIQRCEEQQNNLVRIKDLYKDEIKKLIEKNEVHTREFEIQIKKLKEELESSESYHNLEAIRQLFIKIIGTISYFDDPNLKNSKEKRDEKRKELDEYLKVMCSILNLESNNQNKLMLTAKK